MILSLLMLAAVAAIALIGTSVFVHRFALHLRRSGRQERPEVSQTGIVLGAYTDGFRPSLPLRSRLRAALHLYRCGIIQSFIVSGGQGEDETVSEARSMKRFLIINGVPPNVIFEDRWSKDTWENLKNSKQLMQRLQFTTAVIVTSDYHLPRALAVARMLDMNVTGFAAYSTHGEFHAAIREVFAHIQYTLQGRQSLF
ncbi:YdcF family protein [Alicyclobacillus fastidiosus]|uniref:YdcF family protein n=1 Tax=Alicyclobacillus fastidiosus TaxID=392011 RepID=A0ABV5ACG2_9BACL|nr:YdcF family protein [Alicyclobacillus fastidiosus]WEH11354.1 YdcF family protein [Alicyclobacillus fastidiosus]